MKDRSTSSTILLMSYGYSTANGDRLQLVKIAEDAMDGFSKASEPGWLVDSVPIRKFAVSRELDDEPLINGS